MAEIRINATGGVKLYDADDSHYAQIVAGTITSNVDAITLGHNIATFNAAVTATCILKTDDTTEATSTTDGSLQTDGGLSVAKDTVLGDDLKLLSDSSVIAFGADGDTTLTHTDGTGLTLNSTNKLCFNDATQFIQGASGTVLDIAATDEIELTATLLDVNANLDVSGTSLLPTLGVITAKDLGVGVHIRTADSGASVNGEADELVIEGSGYSGITILSGASQGGAVMFGDSGDNGIGRLYYDHGSNVMQLVAGANKVMDLTASTVVINEDSDDVDFRVETNGQTHALFVDGASDGHVSINESAPDTGDGGLCLNQTSNDDNILTFKSNDVAHGMTDDNEADTYMTFGKYSPTQGGGKIKGYSEDTALGLRFESFVPSVGTTKSTSGRGATEFTTYISDGSAGNSATVTDNGNLISMRAGNTTRFVFDEDGDFHADSSSTTFDAYDDAQLVRAFDLSKGKGVIDSKFDKFVAYNHEHLADLQLVGREDDGTPNHFINVCGFQRLHNGAIWQQYEKHQQLLEVVYDLAKEVVGEKKANAILEKHEVKRLQ